MLVTCGKSEVFQAPGTSGSGLLTPPISNSGQFSYPLPNMVVCGPELETVRSLHLHNWHIVESGVTITHNHGVESKSSIQLIVADFIYCKYTNKQKQWDRNKNNSYTNKKKPPAIYFQNRVKVLVKWIKRTILETYL